MLMTIDEFSEGSGTRCNGSEGYDGCGTEGGVSELKCDNFGENGDCKGGSGVFGVHLEVRDECWGDA